MLMVRAIRKVVQSISSGKLSTKKIEIRQTSQLFRNHKHPLVIFWVSIYSARSSIIPLGFIGGRIPPNN